jgi:hypothetical protein
MLETLGQRVCRIIVKKSRPTAGSGPPLIVATGCTRRDDRRLKVGPNPFGAAEKQAGT